MNFTLKLILLVYLSCASIPGSFCKHQNNCGVSLSLFLSPFIKNTMKPREIFHNFHIVVGVFGLVIVDVGILFAKFNTVGLEWMRIFENVNGTTCIWIGVAMVIYGLLGYYGTEEKSSGAILAMFCSFVTLLIVVQTAFSISLHAKSLYYKNYDLQKVFQNEDNHTVHIFQKNFQCCGLKSPRYWDDVIPPSCHDDRDAIFYKTGCQKALEKYIQQLDRKCNYFWTIAIFPFLLEISSLAYLIRKHGVKRIGDNFLSTVRIVKKALSDRWREFKNTVFSARFNQFKTSLLGQLKTVFYYFVIILLVGLAILCVPRNN